MRPRLLPGEVPGEQVPAFIITIDTEGDNLWQRPEPGTTRNAEYLERFQLICEQHGLRPTWLVDYDMLQERVFRDFAADVLKRNVAEVGMHLHAWRSPPCAPLTSNDFVTHPYLTEYSTRIMRQKIHALTVLLEDELGRKVVSHRAGRWGFDERYAELLLEEGYTVDCSVTPLVSWRSALGDPAGAGGNDYTAFPHQPYWVDLSDISRSGDSPLLEVPMTVLPRKLSLPSCLNPVLDRFGLRDRDLGWRVRTSAIPPLWLRPEPGNLDQLLRIVRRVLSERRTHAEFMLHSSELMPAGSPTFETREAIERLYGDLTELFSVVTEAFVPMTLSEFRCAFASDNLIGNG